MGSSNSVAEHYTGPNLTEDMMDDYLQLTYLSRKEIYRIHKRMQHICGDEFNVLQRLAWNSVLDAFPELKANPFVDRLCVVFSSQRDDKVSFEDMLDLFSALSPSCPAECKAKWAFKIFDFNNSNALEAEDLSELMDRLTSGKSYKEGGKCLTQEEKEHITDIGIVEPIKVHGDWRP